MKFFLIFTGLFGQALAGSFLAHLPMNMTRDLTNPEYKAAIFSELDEFLGESMDGTKMRFDEIERDLAPMFSAMPKNARGKLDHGAVKYVLHRLFIQRQGWAVSGFEPAGKALDQSEGSSILDGQAPEMVQEVFKRYLTGQGAGLHEVTVIAAMMEQLVFEDMLGKLQHSYIAKGIAVEEAVTREQALDLLSLYMASFIRGKDVSGWTPQQVTSFQRTIYKLYPNWKRTFQHMVEVQDRVMPDQIEFTFDDVAHLAAEVGALFAHWQNEECQSTKSSMLEMQDRETGRVRLVDFYNAALHKGKYQFTETINYLRQIGTLDESDELNPRVIIPNYIIGQSNCVARASYYSVCCLDTCENVFGRLERQLSKPTASPAEISSIVADILASSSPTRNSAGLPPLLQRRLEEVAKHHNGLIPLHGRLFAQWMHLAFPTDCAYPHKTGTVYFNSMEKWERETGERTGSTMQDLEHWSNHLSELAERRSVTAVSDRHDEDHVSGMWTMEEELVTHHKPAKSAFASVGSWRVPEGTWVVIIGLALVFGLRSTMQSFTSGKKPGFFVDKRSVEKWCV